MRSRRPGWLTALAVATLLACGDMRQDELECEEAVMQLQDCCPGFHASNIERWEEFVLGGTFEARFPGLRRWRFGFGGGLAYLGIWRVTDGKEMQSGGPVGLVRAGHDFGVRPNLFLALDLALQCQAGEDGCAFVAGPTLQAGLRF